MDTERLALTVKEAALEMRISERHAWELIGQGVIPVKRLGRRVVVSRVALERFLAEAS